MSGGIAYVWNPRGEFEALCNLEMVDLEALDDSEEMDLVRGLLDRHLEYTGSTVAASLLERWPEAAREFTKVMPTDYRRVLMEQEQQLAAVSAAGGAGG
jgi:glutamate synthase domain-containing protein 3